MSAYNLIRSETAAEAVRKTSAPNLRCVTLSFCTEDQDPASRNDFGKEQVVWMLEFARVRKDMYPESRLEKLKVEFDTGEDPHQNRRMLRVPPGHVLFCEVAELLSWPWEYLEEAKQCAARFGLRVEYEARYTREEWDRAVLGEKVEMCDVLEYLQPGLDMLFL
ncbi:hypothetical protein BKA64DRAFT_275771 [Cadophora sp. MPI-SDFR-AT-0126]|nr:hypothetical protein BKA64DRAFT_275771 [Leotiomycetes sp. MPI-SDFR-AT-0126]